MESGEGRLAARSFHHFEPMNGPHVRAFSLPERDDREVLLNRAPTLKTDAKMAGEKKPDPEVKKKGDMSEEDIKKQMQQNQGAEDEEIEDDEEAKKKEQERLDVLKKEHEEELAREKERVRIEREKIAQEEYKERRKKREESGEEADEEKSLTGSELRAILAEERQLTQKEILGSQIAEKARKLANSDSEATLIVEIHKNRTWPAYLTLDEQLEEAFAIANRRRLMAQNEELKRSLKSKETKKNDTAGTQRDAPAAGEPKLSGQDIQAIKAVGYVWDGAKQLYKKPIAGGKKTLYYDAKSKRRWVE